MDGITVPKIYARLVRFARLFNTCRRTGNTLSVLWSTSVPSFSPVGAGKVEKSTSEATLKLF